MSFFFPTHLKWSAVSEAGAVVQKEASGLILLRRVPVHRRHVYRLPGVCASEEVQTWVWEQKYICSQLIHTDLQTHTHTHKQADYLICTRCSQCKYSDLLHKVLKIMASPYFTNSMQNNSSDFFRLTDFYVVLRRSVLFSITY